MSREAATQPRLNAPPARSLRGLFALGNEGIVAVVRGGRGMGAVTFEFDGERAEVVSDVSEDRSGGPALPMRGLDTRDRVARTQLRRHRRAQQPEGDKQQAISAAGHGGARLRGISRGGFELTQPHERHTQVPSEPTVPSWGSSR